MTVCDVRIVSQWVVVGNGETGGREIYIWYEGRRL